MRRILNLLIFLVTTCQLNGADKRQLAFIQQAEADALVNFWHWDSLSLSKPKIVRDLKKRSLIKELDQAKQQKNLVVVILDKRVEPEGKEVAIDDLVKSFHDMGFKRVVIQLAVGMAHPDGLPILKDSTTEGKREEKPPESIEADKAVEGVLSAAWLRSCRQLRKLIGCLQPSRCIVRDRLTFDLVPNTEYSK